MKNILKLQGIEKLNYIRNCWFEYLQTKFRDHRLTWTWMELNPTDPPRWFLAKEMEWSRIQIRNYYELAEKNKNSEIFYKLKGI